jgi:hypothetical protein
MGGNDLTISTAHSAGGKRAPHGSDKWLISAGIQNNEPQAFCWFKDLAHTIEWHGLVQHIDFLLERRVSRDQAVCAGGRW